MEESRQSSSQLREPSADEMRLLRALSVRVPQATVQSDWLADLKVRDLPDGGMGSLTLLLRGREAPGRHFGGILAELTFQDQDGTPVVASLFGDQNGLPYELDMWKGDSSALIRIPEHFRGG